MISIYLFSPWLDFSRCRCGKRGDMMGMDGWWYTSYRWCCNITGNLVLCWGLVGVSIRSIRGRQRHRAAAETELNRTEMSRFATAAPSEKSYIQRGSKMDDGYDTLVPQLWHGRRSRADVGQDNPKQTRYPGAVAIQLGQQHSEHQTFIIAPESLKSDTYHTYNSTRRERDPLCIIDRES